MTSRTRHILYLDESGGHDMVNIDPNWPVFVLAAVLVGETYYARTLVPRVKKLKRSYGIPAGVALHSRAIRRHDEPFAFLSEQGRRQAFYDDVNALFRDSRIRIYAVVIDKPRLQSRFLFPPNPYEVSLSQLLSLTCGPPGMPTPWRPNVVKIVAESRGKTEDKALQGAYQNFKMFGLGSYGAQGVQDRLPRTVARVFPDRIDFVKKTKIVAGLELADLAAYPIGRAAVNRDWSHPAYAVLGRRLRGLLAFPP